MTDTRTSRALRGASAHGQGLGAESRAEAALIQDGFEILATRARTPLGEIDLVAANADLLCFVEVKTRPTLAQAACALSQRQSARLWSSAEYLLGENPDWARQATRFDLMIVDRAGAVRRIRDVIRLA